MKTGIGFVIAGCMLLLFWGCNMELKSYKNMTDGEKKQIHSILRTDGPSGLSYDQFNTYSEPH
jgi:hypothetical protein